VSRDTRSNPIPKPHHPTDGRPEFSLLRLSGLVSGDRG
jgi:hypothetical protein